MMSHHQALSTKKGLTKGISSDPVLLLWELDQFKKVKAKKVSRFMFGTQNQKRQSKGLREPSATLFKMILMLQTWNKLTQKRRKISKTKKNGRNNLSLFLCKELNLCWQTQKNTSSVAIAWFQMTIFTLMLKITTNIIE